ncbi:efflux transporter outer membrane subunit [Oceanobacter mangrovi]|uniref:efflux transporter outer membrane subunit n=1 Tax=Oceanobacter mangrovi TaxID=2862510 RepID=UPI001C8DF8FD|nr:efflux transporter outer membrane subunit [Oceanobacter mangrovi]
MNSFSQQPLRVGMLVTLLAGAVLASGCAGPQAFEAENVALPQLNSQQAQLIRDAGELQRQWWQQLGSPVLDRLMDEASIDNIDLRQAVLRLQQTQVALKQENADRWPTLSAKASASQNKQLDAGSGWQSGTGLSLTASYTVDLWSRRATLIEQAELDVVAAELDLASARITLQANLATQYLQWLALQSRLELAQQNLQASQALEELVQVRFEAGDASGIEVAQQRNTTLSLQGSLMSLQQEVAASQRALAALLGKTDLKLDLGHEHFDAIRIPQSADVQPARLLKQRPDLLSAELALRQRHQDIYLAESDRWPSLSLSAGLSPVDLLSLAGDWTLALGEALSVTLFDGGSSKADVDNARLEAQLARLDYRSAVISAMQEVLDALEAVDYEKRQTVLAQDTLQNNEHLLELAQLRYDSGDTDFSDLLDAQRSFFSARDSLVSQRLSQLDSLLDLYAALGEPPVVASREN